MWKNWKDKIIDFFYEEVESGEKPIEWAKHMESEATSMWNQSTQPTNRVASIKNRHVDTKIAYQYPKQQKASFRFPVVQDQVMKQTQASEKSRRRESLERKLKARRETNAYSKEIKGSAYRYRRKQTQKELENVPAYVRRRMELEQREQALQAAELEKRQEVEQEIETSPHADIEDVEHTKPDELDAVFRKRDAISYQTDTDHQEKLAPYTDEVTLPPKEEEEPNFYSTKEEDEPDFYSTGEEEESGLYSPKEEEESDFYSPGEEEEANFYSIEEQEEPISQVEYGSIQVPVTQAKPLSEVEAMESEYPSEQHPEEANSLADIKEKQVESENAVHREDASIQAYPTAPIIEKQDIPDYLLNDPVKPNEDDSDWLIEQQILLEDTLEHFHIEATVVNVTQGPSVTRFEVQPALGVKVSKIKNLADDLKLNLAAKDIRIEAPIPGKNTIGIEVPNQFPQVVTLQKLIETDEFKEATSPLTIALGLSIEGEPWITNIDKMPHGLIAGATGSGKSVCINTIILSLLYKADYREVKFLLIDPKMVELTPYNGIPHLLSPVITDTKAATAALKWAVAEMEARYEKFVEAGVRNIQKYNEKVEKAGKTEEKMPYIVIIIDELADLMMMSPQEVEDAICRIAQKARACGMHLLLATQRPSVDVITGLIKANIPTRIAFSVSSQIDSRTILNANGAEQLLGKGDMLFVENGTNKSLRLQGPFVSDEEIDRVATYTKSIAEPQYLFEQEQLLLEVEHEDEDELLSDVITFVVHQNQASTSLLQRRFRIGYNRAARLIDSLEDKGIISGQNGSKKREVLATKTQLDDLI